MAKTVRLLMKARPGRGAAFAAAPLFVRGNKLKLEPLYGGLPKGAGFNAAGAGGSAWYVGETKADSADHPWDLAHAALSEAGNAAAAAELDGIEPDLEQGWLPEPAAAGFALADPNQPNPQDPRLGPVVKRGQSQRQHWHLDDDFTQLKAAAGQLGGGGTTIVHLDTGYDKQHAELPRYIHGERTFVDGEAPEDDATDRTPQLPVPWLNRGHGTATLVLLAGRNLGGAPNARVVPCRVANSVIKFYTSSIARGIAYARSLGADVLSMSMGGLASALWAEEVNLAYEAGVVLVTAAGNNFARLPTRFVVFPARFQRVLAACGVMGDGSPYYDRPPLVMQGNHGPSRKMQTALSAYTPNVSWARLGGGARVDMNGQGTSAATPQVAAAAALWLAEHDARWKATHPGQSPARDWRRVERVREALFQSASQQFSVGTPGRDEALGRGVLRAADALQVAPDEAALTQQPPDRASFAFLRALLGFGAADEQRGPMFRLEMTQLAQQSAEIEQAVPDPDVEADRVTPAHQRRFYEAVIADKRCSEKLRQYLERRLTLRPSAVPKAQKASPSTRSSSRRSAAGRAGATTPPAGDPVAPGTKPAPRVVRREPRRLPPSRRLRVFATDPSFGTRLETAHLNEATLEVPWESTPSNANSLLPGPVGEKVEVVDVDPTSNTAYAPVDLNEPTLLAQDGLPPSEGDPKFHQQMAYAVAMTTIRRFEEALGRGALWAVRRDKDGGGRITQAFVPRLRIHPHALRQANAFYSPQKVALLFGYFPSEASSESIEGATVFTCLSHDIIAHETTHALLDGLHPRLREPTNPDVFAFHEAFADIVAILQHFTFPKLLRHELQRTAGNLMSERLAQLAQQFGFGLGRSVALRSALDPKVTLTYDPTLEPHRLGSVLVAAVFDAFLAIYRRRSADLVRLAEGGGTLRVDRLPPELVERLADEACSTADRVLTICVRALDYLPPVDVTFAEYLRALITADVDMKPDDRDGYRVAFLEAFRKREIQPKGVRTYSVESMRWKAPAVGDIGLDAIIPRMDLSWDRATNRENAWQQMKLNASLLHGWLMEHLDSNLEQQLGLDRGLGKIEVHSVRPARRVEADGTFRTDLVAVITQSIREPVDPKNPRGEKFTFRGGCTLIIDTRRGAEQIRYAIMKNIRSQDRRQTQREMMNQSSGLAALYFSGRMKNEPFALLHSGV